MFIDEQVKEKVEQTIEREMQRVKEEISPKLKAAEYKLDHVETATMEMIKQAVKLKREPMVLHLSITEVEAIIEKIQKKEAK